MNKLIKRVLLAEKNKSEAHSIACTEFLDLSLKDAIFCAFSLWAIRQQEIIDGLPASESELLKIDLDEYRKIVNDDTHLELENHDALSGLRERYF